MTELAVGTINNHVKGVKALFKANGVTLILPHRLSKRIKYPDIREKVIISLSALGGFRVGTLVKLQYRHVKKDLEEGRFQYMFMLRQRSPKECTTSMTH